MRFGRILGAECLKLKNTCFWGIHAMVPLVAAAAFLAYYLLYEKEEPYKKWSLILELIAIFMPVLISVVVGIAISVEEKNGNILALLSLYGRKKVLLGKLAVLYGVGTGAVLAVFLMMVTEIFLMGSAMIALEHVVVAVIGLIYCNVFTYVLHLFLQLKFGLGVSLVCGVFECLQGILYSNVELAGGWRLIPFSWSVCWIQDSLWVGFREHLREWGISVGITVIAFWGILQWFTWWEGFKGCE